MTSSPQPSSTTGPGAGLGDSLTFIGTATTILRIGSFTVLTDPNFLHRGQRAYLGWGLTSKRLTDPAVQVGELPPLSAVVLSHLHGDHFDRVARRGLDRSVPIISTQSAARRLTRYGFGTVGLDTWQEHVLTSGSEELGVRALPGVHARGLMGALLPPVMGSMLEHRVAGRTPRRVYLTGDTLVGAHLDEIARRYPDLDVAVVHLGGTRVLMHTVTMDAAQGVEMLRRIPARTAVPVHYDDYPVFRSPLSDFVAAAGAAGLAERVRVVERGQTAALG